MATVSLMQFLQLDPPAFRFQDRNYSGTTAKNVKYKNAPLQTISDWNSFNLATIRGQFAHYLDHVQISLAGMSRTPPPAIGAEDGLRELIASYADRPVRRALHGTFEWIAVHAPAHMAGRARITLGAGSSAAKIDEFVPDRAMYTEDVDNSPNRLPGEVKPTHSWDPAWRSEDHVGHGRYMKRLNQLCYYMRLQGIGRNTSGARYGFMITETGLVAVRKLDARGQVEVTALIPWGGVPTNNPNGERLTVLLALWYLAMLASSDANWTLPLLPGDPSDADIRHQPASSASQARTQGR